MYLRSDKRIFIRFLLTLATVNFFNLSVAQQTPLNPLSSWVFTPYIYNPAMIGSKDFLTLNFNAATKGKSRALILSENTRLSKPVPGYFSSPELKEFTNIGIGGSVFNDLNGSSQNIGVSGAVSYQIPLNTRELSYLSFGASVKGVYNMLDTGAVDPGYPAKNTFYPNVDAGIYYYGTNFFTGVSSINLLGNPGDTNSLGNYVIPVSRQYFFTAGCKFILSKKLNIVLEPSILIDAVDSTFSKITENINPILKLYVGNFSLGSYFLTDGNTSFFFQYRYPGFYLGAFYELPKKTAYFKESPIVELTLGLVFQVDKSRFSRRSYW